MRGERRVLGFPPSTPEGEKRLVLGWTASRLKCFSPIYRSAGRKRKKETYPHLYIRKVSQSRGDYKENGRRERTHISMDIMMTLCCLYACGWPSKELLFPRDVKLRANCKRRVFFKIGYYELLPFPAFFTRPICLRSNENLFDRLFWFLTLCTLYVFSLCVYKHSRREKGPLSGCIKREEGLSGAG